MRDLYLLVLLLGLGVLLIVKLPFSGSLEKSRGYEDVSAQELQAWIEAGEELLLLDVRKKDEFESARIPGACLLPLGELKLKHSLLPANSRLVVVCRSGNRSSSAAAVLANKGADSVYNLTGGMLSWQGEIEKGEEGCRF